MSYLITNKREADVVLVREFRVNPPITKEQLKWAYYRIVNALSPNNLDSGIDLKMWYDALVEFDLKLWRDHDYDSIFLSLDPEEHESKEVPFVTKQGTPLSQLGHGLNTGCDTHTCGFCKGDGYHTKFRTDYEVCTDCFGGVVRATSKCKDCNGTGTFVQERTGRKVECRTCEGTGTFVHPRWTNCPKCKGTLKVPTNVEVLYYTGCWKCKGRGEIEVLNPVISKEALVNLNASATG